MPIFVHSGFIIFTSMHKAKFIIISIAFSLTFVFSECKKSDKENLNIETIQVDNDSYLRSVYYVNDSLAFACGGKRDLEGYIYKTINGGISWSKTTVDKPRCMYDIHFLNDSVGFAGGDFLYLLITTDGGQNWEHFPYKFEELPFHEQNRPAIKKFSFSNAGKGYFVGGEDYNKGVIYQTYDNGTSWSFDTLHQEINFISSKENNAWAAGFGYIGKVTAGSFEQLSLTNDVFTSILELEDQSIITTSNTGGVYKSYDSGTNWTTILKKKGAFSKRVSYNGIAFNGNRGIIITDYNLLISEDYGDNWKEVNYDSDYKLTSITTLSNIFYVSTEGGNILKIK